MLLLFLNLPGLVLLFSAFVFGLATYGKPHKRRLAFALADDALDGLRCSGLDIGVAECIF